jgi:hypothetical protein
MLKNPSRDTMLSLLSSRAQPRDSITPITGLWDSSALLGMTVARVWVLGFGRRVQFVGNLWEICAQSIGLCTALGLAEWAVGKTVSLCTSLAWFVHAVFHGQKVCFVGVIEQVIPAIHRAYNNNYKINILHYSY